MRWPIWSKTEIPLVKPLCLCYNKKVKNKKGGNGVKLCKKRVLGMVLVLCMLLQLSVTAVADSTETPVVPPGDPGVNICGVNVVLDGEIGLVYHVFVPTDYRTGSMTLTCRNHAPVTVAVTACDRDDDWCYVVPYPLSAVELSEPVTLTVHSKSGTVLATDSCSVAGYAEQLLSGSIATAAEKDIVKALINYGHYAQLACSEANGWEIGRDYAATAAYSAPQADDTVFDKYAVQWSGDAVDSVGLTLRLDYRTGIVLYAAGETPPTVTVNGQPVSMQPGGQELWRADLGEITAQRLTEAFTVTVDGVTATLCAFSYGRLAVENHAAENTLNAVRALYEFYAAIAAYYGEAV